MVDFIEKLLRMPRAVLTIMVLLIIGGVSAYTSLPKESFPAIDVPYFYVSATQTGISPGDAERLIAKPIEDRLQDLDGLEAVTSTSTQGHVSVFLEFNVNTDKDEAYSDITDALDGVTAELPSDADDPTVHEIALTDVPVLSVALYGDVTERTLINRAEELQEALENIEGVREAELRGIRDEVLEVTIDQLTMEAYNLTAPMLVNALQQNNTMVPGGTLDTGQGSFNVQVNGLVETASDVYNMPVKTENGTVVTFGDIATVTRTFEDAQEYSYVNGSPAITIEVKKELGSNIIEVADVVRSVTAQTTADWPDGVQTAFLLDQSVSTLNLYRSLEAAVLTAVALVLIMCVATLGLRPAVLIGMSIPLSFMMAFLVLQIMGITVNMMVMFGLVIAVGVLVDDPIVVVEYAERKLAEGVSRKEAFIMAARKMFVPVVSATATTLSAFVPLLFWPGIIGKFMSYLPIVVIVTMVASLVSALLFMPIIGAFIAKNETTEEEREAADIVMYPEKFHPSKVPGVIGVYVRMMNKLLHHPVLTLVAGFAIIGAIFMLYVKNPTGVEAFPSMEPEYGTVSVVTRGNYSPIEVRDMLLEVQDEVLQVPGIQEVVLAFGGGDSSPPDTIGNLSLQLQPWSQRRTADEIFTEIRERTADISGLEIQISEQESGPPAGKAINLRVEGSSYEEVEQAVGVVRAHLEEMEGTVDIEDGRPAPGIQWDLEFDRAEASKYGLGLRDIGPYIQLVTSGVTIGSYRPEDATDEINIVVRLPEADRTLQTLDELRIVTPQGQVPVSNFVTRRAEPSVGEIQRRNGVYAISVAANLLPGYDTAASVDAVQAWDQSQDWPGDIELIYGGAEEQMGDTNAFMVQAFTAAMFLIFLVLLLEYNSFYQVIVTLSTVLMSIAGVLLGMVVTGMSFSAIMSGLGIVALTGIVVKNGIVLIDTYNHYHRDDGVDAITAMLLTVAQRIRPVLLTATVTALGVIPMALNVEFDFIRREIQVGGLAGQFFIHLSAALVSGLFVSTLLTLVMVPVMVTAPTVIRDGAVRGWQRIRGRKPEPEAEEEERKEPFRLGPEHKPAPPLAAE
ncbi:efflux RND transporter permease subunit [Pseudoroseicyclus tamaricis]|uniref:Efflux RND transporter permease subunit n=1 Tax=Pseudoroseicyclus tamaricis TaxID=2705421 RepID=A0A6B2K2C9_9RHOB|nr:efflux RND transporter permease subunit [Pseudoroseicyclus tamaricis]NDV01932.1 efflux RND transporter permease subunit [Pseudoroseicyclus tamaricis]